MGEWVNSQPWSLDTVPVHAVWAWSWGVGVRGGALTRESDCRGERSQSPRGELPDLQSSPAHRLQMSLQDALGDLNSRANLKAQLIPATAQVQAAAKTCAACFFADVLAFSWAHLRYPPASGANPTARIFCCCQPTQGRGAILNPSIYYLTDEPNCVSLSSLFCLVMLPGYLMQK